MDSFGGFFGLNVGYFLHFDETSYMRMNAFRVSLTHLVDKESLLTLI